MTELGRMLVSELRRWNSCGAREGPYYQVTYDHITPVARTLRCPATQREATKEVDPSISKHRSKE